MIKRADVILLAAVLLIGGFIWLGLTIFMQTAAGVAVVYVNGERVGEYALSDEAAVTLRGYNEGYNLLLTTGGMANVTDASCPDRFCVRQRAISLRGEAIICLPHRLAIVIESGEESGIDSFSY